MKPDTSSPRSEYPACACGSGRPSGWSTLGAVLLLATIGLWQWHASGSEPQTKSSSAVPHAGRAFDHAHSAWTRALQRYVRAGQVDYAALNANSQGDFGAYLRTLESVDRRDYDSWTREQRLAYWINAYNAYTVRLILNHYPLKSIRSIGLLPGAAFRDRFIPLAGVSGKDLSLNDIEHEILRKQFQEPRIHFAIVCASKSCPVLRAEAYRAKDVDAQLNEAARGFIRDTSKNNFDSRSRTLRLSSIFNWFRDDFERSAKTLGEFVARYTDESTATALRSDSIRVEFLDYDWDLNGR